MEFYKWYQFIGGQFSKEIVFITPLKVNNYIGLIYTGTEWIISDNLSGKIDHKWASIKEPKVPQDIKRKLFRVIFKGSIKHI